MPVCPASLATARSRSRSSTLMPTLRTNHGSSREHPQVRPELRSAHREGGQAALPPGVAQRQAAYDEPRQRERHPDRGERVVHEHPRPGATRAPSTGRRRRARGRARRRRRAGRPARSRTAGAVRWRRDRAHPVLDTGSGQVLLEECRPCCTPPYFPPTKGSTADHLDVRARRGEHDGGAALVAADLDDGRPRGSALAAS